MMRLLSALAILAALATGAAAEPFAGPSLAGNWDFSIQTRYTWAADHDAGGGASLELEDDLGWGFGFGKYLSEQVNLGIAFAWRSQYYSATMVSGADPADTHVYQNRLDTSTIALVGEYAFGQGRLRPYLSGNVGWLRVNTNITADVDVGCWWDPWLGYVCSGYATTYGTDALAYGLGIGGRFALTPTAFLKVGWDRAWADLDTADSNDVLRIDLGFLM